ncbi:C-type lectin domain family 4 member E-like [Ylistrum balloti]|uniref:C-type lectin domain family 4 member E-like n=1 Tax=Ylistrum balloti TaxID=509963 RepID=UPI002905EC2B|nr:C-type lectin domain family 4 member E-like [Ylistrum balloti]
MFDGSQSRFGKKNSTEITMAIVLSETYTHHMINHTSQTCGDLLFSRSTSSWTECALICLLQIVCYMFEFSEVTNDCDVYTGIATFNTLPSQFAVPRVVYKGDTSINKMYFYIGLTDAVKEGQWKWIDGTPFERQMWSNVGFNNFDGNYPDMHSADCAVLGVPNLFDEYCNGARKFICERPHLV